MNFNAYYNEIDPFAAQWLRELIKAGHIAPGVVDERSIEDVSPTDLKGFTQCHFFAGVGVWSYALRLAGWPDSRPVWTGSCPCQPFSAAGKSKGFADERHLWPAFYHLIEQCNPSTVFGEQVASKATEPWFDLVQADMEAMGYAFGCVPFPSAGVGAPHLRDRAYWVGHSERKGLQGHAGHGDGSDESGRLETLQGGSVAETGGACGLADLHGERCGETRLDRLADSPAAAGNDGVERRNVGVPGPTNGFWRAADWLGCRDEKWRPVEPGTFPLANGAPARVGRLRGYGNAINAEAAKAFIEAYNES